MDDNKALVSAVRAEFATVKLGDARLNKRLGVIAGALATRPDVGFPQAMPADELQAFYQFVESDRTEFEALLAPHRQATIERMQTHSEVVVSHDTSEFRFTTKRQDLGRLRGNGERAKRGFLGHFALAIGLDGTALGVLGVWPWVRGFGHPTNTRKTGMQFDPFEESEHARWARGVQQVHAAVPNPDRIIHVMDSEADAYALLAELVQNNHRFVIRQCQDRRVETQPSAPGTQGKMKALLGAEEPVGTRPARVSARRAVNGLKTQRRHLPREARQALLSFSAVPVVVRRSSSAVAGLPETLRVHVVRVWEEHPPSGVEPLEWLLITTEPISTPEQIRHVVDLYRRRWVIEEFFKALKTGCAFEKRQLESFATLATALAIFIPIAWALLRLRSLPRSHPNAPATTVLSVVQIEVLRRATGKLLPAEPTARDALLAVARLGGHLKSNGEPGWQVLGRGYEDLLMLEKGFRLATGDYDQSLVPEADHS